MSTAAASAYRGWPATLPLWWRLAQWAALAALSGYASSHVGVARQIAGGVTLLIAGTILQFGEHPDRRLRIVSLVLTTGFGLAGTLLSPSGIAEIAIAVAAARIPASFSGHALRVVTVLDAVLFGAAVAWISRSWPGLLAALAIPFMVQRALDRAGLIAERDRAQALLAEVQAGREAEAQTAALRERGRLARELHDVLAHSLAGLSLQLQAVRAVASREGVGGAVLDPLDKAAALARDGLDEARAVVGTLRDPGGLGVADVAALVERHPGDARLTVTGEPGSIAAEAGHAVYRAVQEALTNAARYAPGAAVEVNLAWAADALTVVVADGGPPPGHVAVAGQSSGLGLAGMDERVRAVGGRLRAGPDGAGGWRVEITVPVEAP